MTDFFDILDGFTPIVAYFVGAAFIPFLTISLVSLYQVLIAAWIENFTAKKTLKKITEERDGYFTKVQILAREIEIKDQRIDKLERMILIQSNQNVEQVDKETEIERVVEEQLPMNVGHVHNFN